MKGSEGWKVLETYVRQKGTGKHDFIFLVSVLYITRVQQVWTDLLSQNESERNRIPQEEKNNRCMGENNRERKERCRGMSLI